MNKYHILGMNTSNIIEIKTNNKEENNENGENNNKNEENKNDEENNDKNEEQKEKEKIEEKDNNNQNNENKEDNANKENNAEGTNNENQENDENNVEYIHQAIRFTKHLSTFINSKVQELNNQNAREFSFNERIFSLLDSNIVSKEIFMNLLKDNCVGLYKFLNKLKNEKSLTNDDKLVLNITNDENLKFIQFCLMIIYNKLTSSILDSQKINFTNLKIGFFPGSSILSEIIQSQSEIMAINLKNNDIFSNGVKEIMNPIFNQKKIYLIGKNLTCLCLDGNKLDGKSMKYIRHLIKVSNQLTLINFSNNFIKGSSLRHLLRCTKNKENMSILHLNNNLLGEKCGENLSGILNNLTKLKELNLSCNCLGDKPIPLILNPLKKNASIEILYLSCNDIGPQSGPYLANFLSNNKNLKILTLNNNPLTASGIKSISQALNTKLVLEEINLNSTSAGDEGGAELFENMKLNKSLRKVYANNNKFYKNSMINFGELLKKDNDDPNSEGGLEFLSLSYNEIDDECVGYFSQDLANYKWLREIKLNNNRISEKGGQEILFATLQNENIYEVNLENNNAEWTFSNEDFKHYRDNINIYL
jgi:Ran GTPase-activating protein (RanGAP) involved in mRNA processing and transport